MASGDTLLAWNAAQANLSGATNEATFDSTSDGQLVLDFDATTNEFAVFYGVMPSRYSGGGLTIKVHLAMSTASSGDVDLDVQFARLTGEDLSAVTYSTAVSQDNNTVAGSILTEFTVTLTVTSGTQMDSVVAGDFFAFKITRDAASDTATGDMELLGIEIRET